MERRERPATDTSPRMASRVTLHQEGGGGGGKPLVPRDVQGQPVQEGSLYSKGVHNLKGHVYIAPAFKGGLDADMAIPGQ